MYMTLKFSRESDVEKYTCQAGNVTSKRDSSWMIPMDILIFEMMSSYSGIWWE